MFCQMQIDAHHSPLAAMVLSFDGMYLATASEQGTIIRIHLVSKATKVNHHTYLKGTDLWTLTYILKWWKSKFTWDMKFVANLFNINSFPKHVLRGHATKKSKWGLFCSSVTSFWYGPLFNHWFLINGSSLKCIAIFIKLDH